MDELIGKLCLYDAANTLKQKDRDINVVRVVGYKKKLFGKKKYTVISSSNITINNVDGKLLVPALFNEGMDNSNVNILIRYPEDMPVLTNRDMEVLQRAIHYTKSYPNLQKGLQILNNKLEYFIDRKSI